MVFSRIKSGSFLVRLYPELSRFKDALERGTALSAAIGRLFYSIRGFVLFCLLIVFALPAHSYLRGYVASLQWPWFYSGWLYALATSPIFLAFVAPLVVLRRKMRLFLRQELRRHGIPICLHCGYDVTGCTSLICPECGTDFEP